MASYYEQVQSMIDNKTSEDVKADWFLALWYAEDLSDYNLKETARFIMNIIDNNTNYEDIAAEFLAEEDEAKAYLNDFFNIKKET